VTHGFWQGYLHSDPAAVGRSLVLNGQAFTVLGVLPESYRAVTGWIGPGLYVPLSRLVFPAIDERGTPSLSVMARLAPNATAEQAQLAVTAFGASLERSYPDRDQGMGRPASVFPADALQFRGTPARFFLIGGLLWASVALVLLIAAVNVTGLLMARAASRRSEIAIRISLGAGRGRVVQAMLVESFLLVLAGAAIGLPLAFALSRYPWPAAVGPLQGAMTFDARLLQYALGVVGLTTLVCGLIPALRATRADVLSEVRQSGGGVTGRLWLRHALVVGQVAMSLLLIVFALLCVRSQIYIGSANLGFDIDHGVVASFSLDANQYPGDARLRFADRVVERIQQLPGVASVSMADLVPLGGDSLLRSFHPAGRTDLPGSRPSIYSVGPRYFQSLAIPVLRGREFDASQVAGTPTVVIVNETFANTHFPGRDALGQRVQTGGEPEAEVIGVVRDSRIDTIGEAPRSVLYYPFAQRPGRLIVHVRTEASPETMVSTVVRAIQELDGTIPVSVHTLRAAASLELTMRMVGTVLIGSIGVVGLLLTMIGLYGVMAYVVASRTVEIAIRMALGASAARVRREVLGQVFSLVAAGVTIGGAAAVSLTPALRTFLVGISPFDPIAFGSAALLLAIVGLAAGLVPAVRGSRIAPMRALRRL
jgi:predicted permease